MQTVIQRECGSTILGSYHSLQKAITVWINCVCVSSSSPSSMLLILIVFEQIVIGAIIENTPAERDGRLRPGDELISVDKNVVAGKPHKFVIDLMHAAARNGQVSLTVRRRVQMPGEDTFYIVLLCFFCLVLFLFFDTLSRLENMLHISLASNLKKTTWTHVLTICVQDQYVPTYLFYGSTSYISHG